MKRDSFTPIRFQGDGLQDKYSAEAGISFEGTELLTRQEFLEESKITNVLKNYGLDAVTLKEAKYDAIIDERIDLQTALFAVGEAKAIMPHVPDELRAKYDHWSKVLNAAESGEYQYDLDQLEKRKKETADMHARQKADAEELTMRRERDKASSGPVT